MVQIDQQNLKFLLE
jgi:hypothetical protein